MMKRCSGLAFLAVGVFAGFAIFQFIGCSQSKSSKITDKNNASVEKPKSAPDSIKSLQKALEEMTHGWHYQELQDKMGRGTIKTATTLSLNTISFNFPYQGAQRAGLVLRSDPRDGNSVILMIEKGQFLTDVDGCRVMVRFDEDKPLPFLANGPEDNSTTAIFIKGYPKFVTRLLSSKKVMIEAPFYQEGNQIFEFKVDSLVWSKPPKPPLSYNERLKREYKAVHPY